MKLRFVIPNIIFLILLFVACEDQSNPFEEKNSPPVIINQSFGIAENSPNGTFVGTLAAFDLEGDKMIFDIINPEEVPFEIEESTGDLLVKDQSLLIMKSHPQFIFMVKVTDIKDSTLNNTARITVVINNQSHGPIISNQSFEIMENSPNGTLVGTIEAFDLDGDKMKFDIINPEEVPFEIEESTGNLLVKDQTLLTAESHPQFIFMLKVTDIKDSTLNNTARITVVIKNQSHGPIINNQVFEIDENSPNGTLVNTIVATDLDGDELNFEILNTEDVPFEIEDITGKLLVKDQSLLNAESHSKYTLLVKVTDNSPSSLSNFATVTVVVKNMSEFPNAGIIARYPFNGNAQDIGPNAYNGRKVDIAVTTNRKGIENSALSFNGSSSCITLHPNVGTGVRSISMWFMLDINIDNRNDRPYTLITRDGNTYNRKLFALGFIPNGWAGDGGKLRFMYSRTTEDIYYVQSNSSFWRKDIWHHVVVTIDPVKGMMMYVDNVKQDAVTPFYDATDATDLSDQYPLNVFVGNYSPWSNRNFSGKIDDLVVFNKPLSEDEIDELYKE